MLQFIRTGESDEINLQHRPCFSFLFRGHLQHIFMFQVSSSHACSKNSFSFVTLRLLGSCSSARTHACFSGGYHPCVSIPFWVQKRYICHMQGCWVSTRVDNDVLSRARSIGIVTLRGCSSAETRETHACLPGCYMYHPFFFLAFQCWQRHI